MTINWSTLMNEQQFENSTATWTPSQQNISQWLTQSISSGLTKKNPTLFDDLKELKNDFYKAKSNGTNFKEVMSRIDQLLKDHNPNRKVAALLRAKE
jgi:hypothetical protein